MLERVLEQEVLDSEQDAHEYATFDNSAVNQEFVARVLELAPPTGLVLDIGTGPGDIAILLAQQAPGLRILAIDLGEHMLRIARTNVERAGLRDRVEIARIDGKATGKPGGTFDVIISNSLVHHIPEPSALLREVQRISRPGAAVFIKDLERPTTETALRSLVDKYADGCTPYQRQSFAESLHSALTLSEVTAILSELDWPGIAVRRCSDRHWCIERPSSVSAARGTEASS